MTKRCCNILAFLKILNRSKSDDLVFLFEVINDKSKGMICELVYNVLYNIKALKMSDKKIKRIRKLLQPYKKDFETLANCRISTQKKKKIFRRQVGNGVFSALISALIPAFVSLVANKIRK